MQNKVELLLPVGTKEMALAAIHNGADAIFIGVPGFNARGRSIDFELSSLQEIINLCHLYQVKVNLAFNILIFQEELSTVVELLEKILPLNPDAFIVQDIGLVQIIRNMAPQQKIHASTQMTITNFESIELLSDLNIHRFVLGRENSINEIKTIRENTKKELEVFVHGALCVSYSGQCFTSESLGGRSANRGQCAQSCRFSYELYVDGEKKDLGDKQYLVSPQDLCGVDEIPELIKAGVNCFKVEGRLKTPEYVSTSAKTYRAAIDHTYFSDPNFKTDSEVISENKFAFNNSKIYSDFIQKQKKNLAVSYSRGFFSGWLHGVNHQQLVTAKYSSHRGYQLGTITAVNKNSLTVMLKDSSPDLSLVPGDGVLWTSGSEEQGGFIYSVKPLSNFKVELEFSRDLELNSSLIGSLIFQNHDKELKKVVNQTLEDKNLKKRILISVFLTIEENQPIKAIITDHQFTVHGESDSLLVPAKTSGISNEQLKEEFSSLSGSLFKLNEFKINHINPNKELFLSHREIKKLRQKLIADLTNKRETINSTSRNSIQNPTWIEQLKQSSPPSSDLRAQELNPLYPIVHSINTPAPSLSDSVQVAQPKLNLLLRERRQVVDLIKATHDGLISSSQIDTVILDFEFGRDYQSSLLDLKVAQFKVGIATTRILKPNEYRTLKNLIALKPDSILIRNLGALHYLNQNKIDSIELHGDFSLNVTNHLTAQYFLSKGLNRLCLSYDLNYQQITALLEKTSASKMEVTIFQHMPSFHMEHCVFAAFLSKGTSFRDCGKPCEQHEVKLKDQFQNWHQIKADPECRNTMYNAKPQSAARPMDSWLQLGLGSIRFEALKEQGQELISKIISHLDFIDKKINHQELLQQLGSVESYGVSEGALIKDQEYKSRKKDLSI